MSASHQDHTMAGTAGRERLRWRQLLDPIDRMSEVLFGLIMALTFTGSLSVAESGRAEVRAMLIGALGCNLAWGIIDGTFYLMGRLAERGRTLLAWRSVRRAATPEEGHRLIVDALPPVAASALSSPDVERIRLNLLKAPSTPDHPTLNRGDWLGALAVFCWVFFITLPVAAPFLFMQDVLRAMRVSNGIAVGLMFVTGLAYGRYTGFRRPWAMGLTMVLLGMTLVALTIALGG